MISVALAAYNGARFIREQIDSILAQTVRDFELVVCDDCSSDSTPAILREYALRDPRVKVFANGSNLGFKRNFERAIGLCSGEFIALSDQDDVWLPEHLEVLLDAITAGGEDVFLSCANALLVDADGNSIGGGQTMRPPDFYVSRDPDEQFLQSCYQNYAQGCALMFRAELKDRIIPVPDEEKYHDYWILWAALSRGRAVYTDDVIVRYRQTGGNVTGAVRRTFFAMVRSAFTRRSEMRQSMAAWLLPVGALPLTESRRRILKIARDWWRRIRDGKSLVPLLGYYVRNYKLICCTRNYRLCAMRVIRKIIFRR